MLIFRRGTEEDIQRITELEAETFSDAWSEQGLYESFCQKHVFMAVAEIDGVFAGYCIMYCVMDEAEIARIAVSETARRRGIGKGLLDYACEQCRAQNIVRLLLDVRESNEGAIAFYKKHGFQTDGIRKNFYELPKENAVLMSLQLT